MKLKVSDIPGRVAAKLVQTTKLVATGEIVLPKKGLTNNVEAFHDVGQPGEIAFTAPWGNFAAYPDRAGSYLKDPLGFVWLSGLVTGGPGGAAGQTIFTLPEGYRPAATDANLIFSVISWNAAVNVHGLIEVTSAGLVRPYLGAFGAGTGHWLSGVKFKAEG
jgi:hypothetical protein